MKTAILFPGYGGQFIGMAKDIYDDSRIMQEYFEEASNCLNTNFVKLCFASSDTDIAQMSAAYPSIFLVSCALYTMIKDKGIEAAVVIGSNTGEYAALYAAKSITFPDGLYLLNKYALYYQQFLEEHAMRMASIQGISYQSLASLCKKASTKKMAVYISSSYTNDYHIIGGHADAVQTVIEQSVQHKEVSTKKVSTAYGLHSVLMEPVVDQFKMFLEKVDFKDPSITCMNAQGRILSDGEQIKRHVIETIVQPLSFTTILETVAAYDLIIQVGPGDFLGKLVKEKYPDKIVIIVQEKKDFDELASYISQQTVDTETTEHGDR